MYKPRRCVFALAAACLALSQAVAEPIDPRDSRVIDGDTIHINNPSIGLPPGLERIEPIPNVRLVGFDAPETFHPECEAERVLGLKATERLRALVRAGRLDFVYVRCSCPESQIGTHWCNYGRDCGMLKANGRDVATDASVALRTSSGSRRRSSPFNSIRSKA